MDKYDLHEMSLEDVLTPLGPKEAIILSYGTVDIDLNRLNNSELKAIAGSLGLKVTGSSRDLVDAIKKSLYG